MSNKLMGIHFSYVIQKQNNEDITEKELDNLLDQFIELVEANGMICGGGSHLTDVNQETCEVCGEW